MSPPPRPSDSRLDPFYVPDLRECPDPNAARASVLRVCDAVQAELDRLDDKRPSPIVTMYVAGLYIMRAAVRRFDEPRAHEPHET